jgi:hypothetical protein
MQLAPAVYPPSFAWSRPGRTRTRPSSFARACLPCQRPRPGRRRPTKTRPSSASRSGSAGSKNKCKRVSLWRHHVEDRAEVGAKLAAGLFNRESDIMRNLMVKSSDLAAAKDLLLSQGLTEEHLFRNMAGVTKALKEAKLQGKRFPYQPNNFKRRDKNWPARAGTPAAMPAARQTAAPQRRPAKPATKRTSGNGNGRPFPSKGKRGGRKSRE